MEEQWFGSGHEEQSRLLPHHQALGPQIPRSKSGISQSKKVRGSFREDNEDIAGVELGGWEGGR